jgi:hypothetical protein
MPPAAAVPRMHRAAARKGERRCGAPAQRQNLSSVSGCGPQHRMPLAFTSAQFLTGAAIICWPWCQSATISSSLESEGVGVHWLPSDRPKVAVYRARSVSAWQETASQSYWRHDHHKLPRMCTSRCRFKRRSSAHAHSSPSMRIILRKPRIASTPASVPRIQYEGGSWAVSDRGTAHLLHSPWRLLRLD